MVREVQVRPRSFARPLVVGTLYLDAATAQLVRFRFSFTPAAYLDAELEDISIVLENSLYEHRYWLPYRQEVEIRRRSSVARLPGPGNHPRPLGDRGLRPQRAAARPACSRPGDRRPHPPRPADTAWHAPLGQAIAGVAPPVNRQDMDALRVEVERIAGARALSGLPSRRLAAGSVSDLAHVNRIQGLTLGFGGIVGLRQSRVQLRPSVAYGTSDHRVTGALAVTAGLGATQVTLAAARRIRDLSDLPVIAPVTNSLLAQEGGRDYGDYVLLNSATLAVRQRLSGRTALSASAGVEESRSVSVRARPATGNYRPNPALGSGTYRVARLELQRASGGIVVRGDLQGRLSLEAGDGPRDYGRATLEGRWLAALGGHELVSRLYLGTGTDGLPPHRSFAIGGRGTLVGEPFRAYGGRDVALGQLEWRFTVPVPAIPLGSFASTGRGLTVAPFVAAGVSGRPIEGLPWAATDGVRPVVGVALEWFMRLIRVEAGVGLRDGDFGLTVDINRDWWGLL